jgi:hypothetical protein
LRGDRITDRVSDDFLSRQWTAGCKEDERHLLAEGKREAFPDAIIRALGASYRTLDLTRERRQVVNLEVLAFGPLPL